MIEINQEIAESYKLLKSKGKYPFRLGCTSYIFPDNIIPNVEAAAPYIDDIELLCFESPDRSYYIDEETIGRLVEIGERESISYTVHCPIDLKAGSKDRAERIAFGNAFVKIFRLTAPLNPKGYVLHLEGLARDSSVAKIDCWEGDVAKVCDSLVDGLSTKERASICLENLDYPVDIIERIVDRYGFSFCIDIGHLWRYGQDWESYCARVLPKTKIIHLHGVEKNEDHIALDRHEVKQLNLFIDNILRQYSDVVTLEVFSRQDLAVSQQILERLWPVQPS
jgi:sugar phosphate isomerase/epimerase